MSHLDEGTIHAWLDDALPPDEAARVEAHARDCAECAAMVAEARGFIAGSSRIVSSLDVVRGDVLPATTVSPKKTSSNGSLWKTLKLTPARAAIAATLLVGVASMLTLRHQDVQFASTPAAEKIAPLAAAVSTPGAPVPSAAPSAGAGTAAVRAMEPERVASAPQPVATRAASPKRDAVARAETDEQKTRVASTDSISASNSTVANAAAPAAAAERKVASAALPSPVAPPAEAAPKALFQRALADTSVARASARSARAIPQTMSDIAMGGMARGLAAPSPQALAAAESRAAGCYRLQLEKPADLRGFPAAFRLARDSASGLKSVHAIDAGRDSVLNAASWRILTGSNVAVIGSDAQVATISVIFAVDSTHAVIRAVTGTTDASIGRMTCPR